jgi:hypothetical protein
MWIDTALLPSQKHRVFRLIGILRASYGKATNQLRIRLAHANVSHNSGLMRQWKIALSLAIIGAIAAPLVCHTYKARPQTSGFEPLTGTRKEEVAAYLARFNNCSEFETIPIDR